jgi:hypothetical protein
MPLRPKRAALLTAAAAGILLAALSPLGARTAVGFDGGGGAEDSRGHAPLDEVRARLQAAEAAKDWAGLLEIARAHPDEVSCGRIDGMWWVAEAQVQTGRRDAAFATYGRIIADCADLDHRIATLQRAKGRVDAGQLTHLFALEGTRTKSTEERARVAAVQHSLTAARRPKPSSSAIQRLFRPGLTRAQAEEPGALRGRRAEGAEGLGRFQGA